MNQSFRLAASFIGLVVALSLPTLARADAPANPAPAPTPPLSSPDLERLRKRLDIARRESALVQNRFAALAAEIGSLREFLDPAALESIDRILAEAGDGPSDESAAPSADAAPGEIAAALERAEARTRDIRARHHRLNAAIEHLGLATLRYKRLVRDVSQQVAGVRALPLQRPVEPVVLTRTQLRDLLASLLAKELTDELVRGEELTWRALGILPAGADLRVLYSGLLEEQVGGLYDDDTQSLYVVDTFDPKSFLGRVILAHEICHALQDQHFPIKDLPFRTKNNDQNMAVAAVLEGDATLLMVEWGAQHFQASDLMGLTQWMNQGTEQLGSVPPPLVQSLVFPYIGGLQFFQALQLNGAPEWRDRPFRQPPQSTEQILHPEKYHPEAEPPIEVELPQWTSRDGLEEVHRGVVGEWVTRLVLTPPDAFPDLTALSLDLLVNEPVAVAGAAGWGGDRIVVVAGPGDTRWFVAWKGVWDDPRDAEEFEQAFERRIGYWPEFEQSEYRNWSHSDGRCASFGRDGVTTLVLVASDAELLGMAREWATF